MIYSENRITEFGKMGGSVIFGGGVVINRWMEYQVLKHINQII